MASIQSPGSGILAAVGKICQLITLILDLYDTHNNDNLGLVRLYLRFHLFPFHSLDMVNLRLLAEALGTLEVCP